MFNRSHQLFFIRRAALKKGEYSSTPKKEKKKETKTPKKKTG